MQWNDEVYSFAQVKVVIVLVRADMLARQKESYENEHGRGVKIFTIGHSNREMEELILMLCERGVRIVADVRTVPKSRACPQFNSVNLEFELERNDIDYTHLKELGGLRRPRKDSMNMYWRNNSFRGFADYMQSGEFESAIDMLMRIARERTTAILCAEAVPWRCHRSLIADALSVRGIMVTHVIGRRSDRLHQLTAGAKTDGVRVTYPLIKQA